MIELLFAPTRFVGLPDWLALIGALLGFLYWYGTSTHDYFTKRGVPGPKPWPVAGNIIEFMKSGMPVMDMKYLPRYDNIMYGTFMGRSPQYIIGDVELVKQITIKEFSNFVNRNLDTLPISKYFADGLSIIKDEKWKGMRNVITPTFSSAKMRALSPVVDESAKQFARTLARHAKNGKAVEMKSACGHYSMDVVGSALFGVSVDSGNDENNPFVKHAKNVFEAGNQALLGLIFMFPGALRLLKFLDIEVPVFGTEADLKFFADHVEEFMKMRGSPEFKKRVDFLALLMGAHNAELDGKDVDAVSALDTTADTAEQVKDWRVGKRELSHVEIVGNALLFFIAGYETTATAMSWTLYCLSRDQDAQERLYDEVAEALADNDGVANYDMLAKMPYLDACLNEALRLFPPAQRFDRKCNKACDVTDSRGKVWHFEEGSWVQFSIWAIHRNEKYFPNAESFQPERFLPENKHNIVPYSFLSFGQGPRNCVGQRLAYMEAKIGLMHAVHQFKFSLDESKMTQHPPVLKPGGTGFTVARDGLHMLIEPR